MSATDVLAVAEERLGRPLTYAERQIDIAGADRDLKQGKERLHAALEKEKARVVRSIVLRGRPARVKVTKEAETALRWLYERGRAHALAEMERMGVSPSSSYASRTLPVRIRFMVDRLRGLLGGVQARVVKETDQAAVVIDLGEATRAAVARRLARQIPGTLDASSRVVSGAFAGGRADVYEEHQDLFAGWQYTAVLDGGTCDVCDAEDGTEYSTLDEAEAVLPNFGPNPDCEGSDRCRCTLVPTGAAVAA